MALEKKAADERREAVALSLFKESEADFKDRLQRINFDKNQAHVKTQARSI